ncbi:MAG: HAMP domain-containing histidine kinase [Candidatus Portnoybacteria bacterium]|nr:HAMP domain-containing histidine kinase [Candidatus Portnoybacteria bacterium]
MKEAEEFQSFDKPRIDPEQSRMGQRKRGIGEAGFVNKNCWLAQNVNYPPSKRCQYCESKFHNCLFFRYLIISSVLIFFLFIISFLVEGKISKLAIISIFVLVIIYGYFFDKSTEKIIQANFAERKARESLEKLAEKLEDQVKQRTKELEVANERLKQLDEAKSEFLSIASHQLRTPLTTIKGVTSMLLEEFWGKLNEEQKKHLGQIYQSEERLLELVEDLLDISRIEAGRMQFNFKLTSLEELIDGQIKELRPLAVKKSLYLHFIKFKSPLPKVLIDVHKIEQVVQNLIDNAIKYTDAGEIAVTLKPTDDHLLFSIRDTGCGVPKLTQPFLFEKFQRGPRATARYTEGAGLGLYWAGKIIKAHHGKIWVESERENKGSAFYFTLPIIHETQNT